MRRAPMMFAISILLGLTEVSGGSPTYIVTELGTLGGTSSYAYGINNTGQVAGYSTISGDTAVHAFRFGGSILNDLSTLNGLTSSTATGINEIGQVVGLGHDLGGTTYHAFRTSPNAAINPATDDLGTLGGDSSYANAINSSGKVVGASKIASGFLAPQHAFLYNGTTMLDLATLGGTSSVAYGINNSGQIVGWSHIAGDSATHSFIYQNGLMIDLGLGDLESEAYAINNNQVVVGAMRPASANIWHAYLHSGSLTIDMGLPPGAVSSFAYALNDLGTAVGYASTGGPDLAFRFSGSSLVNLNDLIDAKSGWTLNRAYGINNSGQIVGQGTINGEARAFLLTPIPEPSVVIPAAIILVLITRARKTC